MSGFIYKEHSALDSAKQACDRMINEFAPEELPPKGEFYYHQGVFLSGMQKTNELCQDF
jgi:unsaturated rhamnogalacturonyl hydrolase